MSKSTALIMLTSVSREVGWCSYQRASKTSDFTGLSLSACVILSQVLSQFFFFPLGMFYSRPAEANAQPARHHRNVLPRANEAFWRYDMWLGVWMGVCHMAIAPPLGPCPTTQLAIYVQGVSIRPYSSTFLLTRWVRPATILDSPR